MRAGRRLCSRATSAIRFPARLELSAMTSSETCRGPSSSLKRAECVAGHGRQRQQRGGEAGHAERHRVLHRPAEPVHEVLVEHPDHDPRGRVELADEERGGDVDQVVAGDDDDRAGVADPGRFEHLRAAAIALHRADAVQAADRPAPCSGPRRRPGGPRRGPSRGRASRPVRARTARPAVPPGTSFGL